MRAHACNHLPFSIDAVTEYSCSIEMNHSRLHSGNQTETEERNTMWLKTMTNWWKKTIRLRFNLQCSGSPHTTTRENQKYPSLQHQNYALNLKSLNKGRADAYLHFFVDYVLMVAWRKPILTITRNHFLAGAEMKHKHYTEVKSCIPIMAKAEVALSNTQHHTLYISQLEKQAMSKIATVMTRLNLILGDVWFTGRWTSFSQHPQHDNTYVPCSDQIRRTMQAVQHTEQRGFDPRHGVPLPHQSLSRIHVMPRDTYDDRHKSSRSRQRAEQYDCKLKGETNKSKNHPFFPLFTNTIGLKTKHHFLKRIQSFKRLLW